MNSILKNKEFLQNYANAISSILEVEVTIVDQNMVRVAGTGIYFETVGKKIAHASFFKSIMNNKKFGIIKEVKKEIYCNQCERKTTCKELANLGYPIFFNKEVIGVIGIIAFTEDQQKRLLKKSKKLEEFLKYMSLLLENKLQILLSNYNLKDQLNNFINLENKEYKNYKFIGESPQIREVLALAKKIATTISTVMITGESGTGKEILAKFIHSNSDRKDKLMISINCAAIPETLVESELFGYEEGAFTGAKKNGNKGKFELADNSTIFLDEIGDMPLAVQAKLLRVLQEYKIQRIGGKESIPINVRVICATNKNLELLVKQGKFREDLFYRLNVIPIHIPPLRERKEDILLFINYFIYEYNTKLKKNIKGITNKVKDIFLNYSWPGNVREIKNIIEYLENIVDNEYIDIEHIPLSLYEKNKVLLPEKNLQTLLEEYEKTILNTLLKDCHNLAEKDEIAKKLGISRATLYRKIAFYNL